MTATIAPLPERMFNAIVDALLAEFGEGWMGDARSARNFVRGTLSLLAETDGLYVIGEPEHEGTATTYNVWVDFPVEDLLVADDLAFGVFGRLAQEIFASTRIIEERGLRYRFVTGNAHGGHLGAINLTGPFAVEFANLQRMKSLKGSHFHA